LTEKYCATFPKQNPATGQYLTDLKDQMIRSARSVVRNIEEGYSRTSTGEYVAFLGFSKGSNEELLGDFQYCVDSKLGEHDYAIKGVYLCKGEGKMLESQMRALKQKQIQEKSFSSKDQAKLILENQGREKREQEKFLDELKEKYLKGKIKGY